MSSAGLAATVVEELVALGIREAVLCPGSRSAPLAYALHQADAQGLLRLHVRIDERGAGFLALALAAATGRPVPVITTSGTAAANLHPAVLEASHRGVALLALTADRPAELVGTGANQTTQQRDLFGSAVRWFAGLDSAALTDARADEAAARVVGRAVGWASGALSADPGPVQLNLAFRPPLSALSRALRRRPPRTVLPAPSDGRSVVRTAVVAEPALPARTVVVAGNGVGAPQTLRALCADRGWPILAEGSAGLGRAALPAGAVLAGDQRWRDAHRPDLVLVAGTPTLHRSFAALIETAAEVAVIADGPRWPDPGLRTDRVLTLAAVAAAEPAVVDPDWPAAWQQAADATAARVGAEVDGSWPSGLAIARTMLGAVPHGAAIQLGSSNPVRDVDLAAAPRDGVRVVANRGLAGIDGTVSSAVGLALAHDGPAYALIGDLTFQHDLTGLLIGPDEPRPDLTVVVVNDDGGGIFSTLEQGAPALAGPFERIFATPTGAELAALCAGAHVAHDLISDAAALARAVAAPPSGLRVLEVRCPRRARRELHHRISTTFGD